MKEEILNAGLDLAMEWGEDWLEQIQARLARSYPSLSRAELDEYDAACQETMKFGHALVMQTWKDAGYRGEEAFERFKTTIRERYPWINDENAGRLFSQASYYSLK